MITGKMKVLLLFVTLQIISSFHSCQTEKVDFLNICETCSANFITQDYKENWEDDLYDESEWKVRMASKLHIYLLAHSLYETTGFRKFTEEDYAKSCLYTKRINGWSITNTTGYNGKNLVMRLIKTTLPKTYRFILPHGPFGPNEGTASVVLSDNFLYTAFEFCFDNGLRTFAVFSRNEISDQRNSIKLHMKSLGFNEKHMVDLKPNNDCLETSEKGVLKPIDDRDYPEPSPKSIYYPGGLISPNALIPVPPLFFLKKK